MSGLDFVLDRTVTIAARRETVFRYFTDSERFAAWWGRGSTIEPRPGGAVEIRFPNAIVAGGEVIEIAPPERVVFSYGFASGQPIPIGASRVTITLEETAAGTLVRLRHELPNAEVRDEHVQGWRYQLAVFANVVAKEAHAGAASLADRFFGCWGETDADKRRLSARRDRARGARCSATRTRARPASTTSSRTSRRASASCRGSCSSDRARRAPARVWPSSTGP